MPVLAGLSTRHTLEARSVDELASIEPGDLAQVLRQGKCWNPVRPTFRPGLRTVMAEKSITAQMTIENGHKQLRLPEEDIDRDE